MVQTGKTNAPVPQFAWQATPGDYDLGMKVGTGATELEAVADLYEKCDDDRAFSLLAQAPPPRSLGVALAQCIDAAEPGPRRTLLDRVYNASSPEDQSECRAELLVMDSPASCPESLTRRSGAA